MKEILSDERWFRDSIKFILNNAALGIVQTNLTMTLAEKKKADIESSLKKAVEYYKEATYRLQEIQTMLAVDSFNLYADYRSPGGGNPPEGGDRRLH